jgi:choline dehydrogenase-like flavoprotein
MRSPTDVNGVPEYDLIICGGGIAGLGLARQLALRGDDISVLVLDTFVRPVPDAASRWAVDRQAGASLPRHSRAVRLPPKPSTRSQAHFYGADGDSPTGPSTACAAFCRQVINRSRQIETTCAT